jgi:ABC-2 type transport system permease protein
MAYVIRAELTKILTLPRVWMCTGVILALHVLALLQPAELFAGAVADITPDGTIEIFVGEPEPATAAILGLLVSSSLQISLLLPILAAVIAGQEFRSSQLGLTVLAIPRRGRLLVGKTLAATGYLLVVSVLIAAISTAFMYAAVRDWNPGLLLSTDAFLGHGKFVVFAVLFSLTGSAITVIARSTLIGIIVSVALSAITMTQVLAGAAPALDALFPVSAARNLLLDSDLSRLTAGPEHGLVVLVGWTLATTVLAGISLRRRDAR